MKALPPAKHTKSLSVPVRPTPLGLNQARSPVVSKSPFWSRADWMVSAWPDSTAPQQLHLDLEVEDLDEAEQLVLRLGGIKPDYQPGETWRVYADPAGHPFCLYEED